LDNWMFYKASCYATRTHPKKSKDWLHRKYWGQLNRDRDDHWVFGDKHTGAYLLKFSWFPIERHVLVKGTSSPDDPHLADYWIKRQARLAKDLTPSKQKLAKRQKGRCPECGQSLFNDEEIQVHHLLARSQGGSDSYRTLAFVHLLCHQHIHAVTQQVMKECQQYNDQELSANENEGAQR
jgi:RNA-directed DNA polymerase